LNPNDAQAHKFLGVILFNKDDADGAVAAYRQASLLSPDDEMTHSCLGDAQER
jgi:cytochrome c-type biogenesis protein CcmH/NrfG